MTPYQRIRPLLFALEPERAHAIALGLLDLGARAGLGLQGSPFLRLARGPVVSDPIELFGLRFSNRVGLAAGLDKNAEHIAALAQLGFGFLEVGTVTPRAQPGNAKPRMFRLPAAQALINRLGFNNQGLAALIERVRLARERGALRGPAGPVLLGINIGKNADTPLERSADDYVLGLQAAYPLADYIAVNISSPNTQQLRALQQGDELSALLARLRNARSELAAVEPTRKVPLLVKIAPDLDDAGIDTIARVLPEFGVDGVIATNTTIARDRVRGMRHGEELGGLSGAPVRESSLRVIARLRAQLPASMPIIGVGGILCGADAQAKIEAGASLVQLYTGLIYEGPALISACARAIADSATR